MSCRIDFKQGNGTQIIDRTFPGILSGKISDGEWNAFCEQIDKAVEPIGAMMKSMMKNTCILMVAVFVVFGITVAITRMTGDKGRIYGPVVFVTCGMILPFYFFAQQARKVRAEGMKIEAEVVSILTAETNKRVEVSFHLRKDPYSTGSGENRTSRVHSYIECSVGTGTGTEGGASMMEQGLVPTATEVVAPATTSIFSSLAGSSAGAGSGPSAAQRLQDLEGIKALISAEEYNAKKKDILDSV